MLEKPKKFEPVITPEKEVAQKFRLLTDEEKGNLNLAKKEGGKSKEKPSDLRTSWKNPESGIEQQIEINIETEINFFDKLHRDNLGMALDREAILSVWNKNYESIKKEIETYGYDTVLIVPDNLPSEDEINKKMIETMDEGLGKGKVAQTYQSDNFKSGGSFVGLINSESPKYRIILTKGEQNIYKTGDPLLKATLGKNIMQLTGLDETDVNARIQKGDVLPVNFKIKIKGKDFEIKADGMSLAEYMIFQKAYFEKTGQHLDDNGGWTWLIKSFSGSRIVAAYWSSDDRQMFVSACDPSYAFAALGLRLSCSFSE